MFSVFECQKTPNKAHFIANQTAKWYNLHNIFQKGRHNMYYIIQVDVDGEKKFVYSSKLLVVNKGLAKKFYSLTYVRRYLKTHPNLDPEKCEFVKCAEA